MTTTPPPTTTPDAHDVVALTAGLSVRDNIAARIRDDPAWLLVLRQYDHGLRGYPDPFVNRAPRNAAAQPTGPR